MREQRELNDWYFNLGIVTGLIHRKELQELLVSRGVKPQVIDAFKIAALDFAAEVQTIVD